LDIVQQELVLLAGQCKDPNMMACYASDPVKDIHSMTTSGFVHMSLEEFDERRKDDKALDAMRTVKGKGTNFLKIFGGGKAKLARKILAPEHEAQAWLDAFDARYPGVQPWKDTMVALCREQGYLTDLLGNRIHVYDRRSGMDQAKAGGVDRQTISKMIQGLAASMLKRTLGELMRDRTFQRYDATFSFPLYDEIAGSCRHEVGFELISEIHAAMTREVPGLGLPMRADISIGLNFGAQVEIGRYPNRAKFDEAIEKLFGGAK
jgi:DNA polymerase-1